jgi:alpha/beta superfamily hydrolase
MSVFSRIGVPSAVLLLMGVSLGGCITSSANSSLMDAHAEAPKPPASRAYMAVEEMPSDRKTPALTADEQAKLKKELTAIRDRQAAAARLNTK